MTSPLIRYISCPQDVTVVLFALIRENSPYFDLYKTYRSFFVFVTGKADMGEHIETKKHLAPVRIVETTLKEGHIEQSCEYQRKNREKRYLEEMMREEQRRKRENDFEEELKKIMQTEKVSLLGLVLLNMDISK